MSNTLKNNSYHVLGLDSSASQKEVVKRSKEIVNRLKIDDCPEYDFDIGIFQGFRTEESVKSAVQKLQTPRNKIKEYFFWLQISDSIDEQAQGLLKCNDYLNAIRVWEKASESNSAKSFFYKKNLAILYCLLLSSESNDEYLKNSLKLWKEIISSEKFWTAFVKIYKLHDELLISQDIVNEFKGGIEESLSDIYTELHEIHNDPHYLNEFQKVFSAKGDKLEKNVLNPAFQQINESVERLEKMKVSEDGKFDKNEADDIKKHVGVIQSELNKLIDLGLYNDSQTKIMRDRAATALRSIALDLHNNLGELEKSHGLHEVAIRLAGTDSLKNKLKNESEQIKKNISDDAENSLLLELPGKYKNDPVIFKNNFLEHNNKRIYFKDATSISFDSTKHTTSVYGISVSTSYTYRWSVASETENVSITLSASKDESEQKEVWAKLIGLTANFIEPLIVKRITDQIFNRGEIIKFGNVEFSKHGYSKMKTKLFGKDERIEVSWSDTIYTPKFDSGMVVLWKDKNGKGEQFATIAMSSPNAVILPELVQACYNQAK